MKKLIIFLFGLLIISEVHAKEINNITENSQIKYKWYKEEIVEGMYHPKKDKLDGYFEDSTNIKYTYFTAWNSRYCAYSPENYLIEVDTIYTYERVDASQYIQLENIGINEIKEIKLFYKNNLLEYEIIEQTENKIKIKLNKSYDTDYLWFYIDAKKEYSIRLSNDEKYMTETLYKQINNEKILVPDKTWITSNTRYITQSSYDLIERTIFFKSTTTRQTCRANEIQTYRYKINKIYYDDKYHTYVENYIRDVDDYIVEYTKELPKEIITVTKTEKEIQKEYIYLQSKEPEKDEIINKEPELIEEQEPIIETKYIENKVIKEVYKVPKKLYIVLALLLLIITILTIVILKKKVERNI